METREKFKLFSLLCCVMLTGSIFAQCTLVQDEVETYIYTQGDFGQSFKACDSGELQALSMYSHHFLTGDIDAVLQIYAGEGYIGSPIFSDTISLSDEWGSIFSINLSNPPVIYQEEQYTFSLSYLGEFGIVWADFDGAYADGHLYWDGQAEEQVDIGFSIDIGPLPEPECHTWTGAQNSDWNNPANWNPSSIPDSSDCVLIPSQEVDNPLVLFDQAKAGFLTIEENAMFYATESSTLSIYESLMAPGNRDFHGRVEMAGWSSSREIIGNPSFAYLDIHGPLFTSEPFTVRNILDLSQGYLLNLGTEVMLSLSDEDQGHLFMPGQAIGGTIIYSKQIQEAGIQVLGSPFQQLCAGDFMSRNSLEALWSLETGQQNTSELQRDLIAGETSMETALFYSSADRIELEGNCSNDVQFIQGTQGASFHEEIQILSNPFPSVIRLNSIQHSSNQERPIYTWIPEKKQFGFRTRGLSSHGMKNILRPTELFLTHVPAGENIEIDYVQTVLNPQELKDLVEFAEVREEILQVSVRTDYASDEFLLKFLTGTSKAIDPEWDVVKIQSLDSQAPTLALRSTEQLDLAMQTMAYPHRGRKHALLFYPSVSGVAQFDFEHSPVFNYTGVINLYDKQLDNYHDVADGSLFVHCEAGQNPHRFELRFGEESFWRSNGSLDDFLSESGNQQDISEHGFQMAIESGEVIVEPEPIQSASTYAVEVLSMNGQQIHSESGIQGTWKWPAAVQQATGIYFLRIQAAEERSIRKFWIGR